MADDLKSHRSTSCVIDGKHIKSFLFEGDSKTIDQSGIRAKIIKSKRIDGRTETQEESIYLKYGDSISILLSCREKL